ncbi:MAG: SpoIIE family protein phosphatase [Gemmatimonadota bacterium]|nr:MAG: SpoIIE family protein phosphatase [Gemmatimonadota bacterium]
MEESKCGMVRAEMDNDRKIVHLENEIRRLKSAVEELTVLNDLAIAASTSMEVNQMLDIIVEKSIKAVKAEQGSILLVTEQDDAPLRTLIRQADRTSRPLTYKVGATFTGWVLKHQEPLLVENVSNDPRFVITEQERKNIRSILCVPIRFRGELLGILTVTNKKSSDSFNSNDLRLLSIIAVQSGQLIRNSHLQEEALQCKRMEDELEMARDIQLGLLPKHVPAVEGLEISSYFSPAEEVSGDYYDYFHLDDDLFGIVIADVSGHGPSAALVMTMVKGILYATTQNFTSADLVISETNSTLEAIMPGDMFVTMTFLVFDMKKRLLRFSNAGHNPLLSFTHQSKSVRLVECQGPILGFSKDSVYVERQIPLNQGDFFLVYTDGVTEAMNVQGEMFNESRLLETVEQSASQKAGSIIDRIRDELRVFTNHSPQSDDIAIVAAKVI